MSTIFIIALLSLPVAAIALIAIAFSARKRTSGDRPIALVVTRVIAAAYAVITLLVTIVATVSTLVADTVDVSMPVGEFWPEAFPWVDILDGPTAEVVGGGYSLAEVTVTGLGMDARLLLAAGHALQGLTVTVIAVTVALLCHRLLAGGPFTRVLSRSVSVAAASIAAGGMLWQACFGIGGSIASEQVLRVSGWTSAELQSEVPGALDGFDPLATGLAEPTFFLMLDFWPLFMGLALAAVAAAFRYGERLQHDTRGLV